jgi:hypothetical protein
MNRRIVLQIALAAAAGLLAFHASAEVLYKLIDKNGKVTYSEEKPKNFDGQVIRIDIDPNANTATLPKGQRARSAEDTPRPRSDGGPKKADKEAQVAAARERLEAAQRALQDVRDHPSDSDVQILGNKGGGVRMLPSAEYQKKLDDLELAVKRAQEELRRLEQA